MRKPFFRIGAHVFYYGALFTVTVGATLLYTSYFGTSEEEKVEMYKKKYPEQWKNSTEKRQELQQFFDKMKNSENDKVFKEVLRGGKGDMKRNYSYDPNSVQPKDSSKEK